MVPRSSRILLVVSSFLLGAGSAIHASAFSKAVSAVAKSDLPPLFGNALKGLWLGDSTTMLALAMIFGLLAARPFLAARSIILLISLIPAGIAAMIYVFMGGFFAGHLLLVSAALAFVAGLKLPALKTTSVTAQRA